MLSSSRTVGYGSESTAPMVHGDLAASAPWARSFSLTRFESRGGAGDPGLIICALLLIPCRRAFNRRSNLLSLSFNPMWLALPLTALGLIVWGGFYSYQHVPYAHSLWVHFSYGDHGLLPPLRASCARWRSSP